MALRELTVAQIPRDCSEPVEPAAREQAAAILAAVQQRGEAGVREYGERFGELRPGQAIVARKEELRAAYESLPSKHQALLERTAARIRAFATAQRESVRNAGVTIPGGRAAQQVAPVLSAGCYAPGGRYPLPSSVLMTAVTARAAGVESVWVASPKPSAVTLAAAHVAGADGLIKVGGAHAIAALAEGTFATPADVIVGPGNKWVTAAKSLVQGRCAIDMLAGPSEVLVIADDSANPATVAADLLAQAEHDVESRPIVLSTSRALLASVNAELVGQLARLPEPNRSTAAAAVKKGFCIHTSSVAEAVKVSDSIGPEHLEVITRNSKEDAASCSCFGGLFVGQTAAEVLGDYGAGPNHVLPTAGTARYTGGLSVFNFLRIRTWMRIDDDAAAQVLVRDAVELARLEGLEGHARAAERRLQARL